MTCTLKGLASWTSRLARLLNRLEAELQSTFVVMESRSGLHDIAAATVTDLNADVLLFAVDAASHWTDYDVLFRHWQSQGVATLIRERLSIVSALTPELDKAAYLQGLGAALLRRRPKGACASGTARAT